VNAKKAKQLRRVAHRMAAQARVPTSYKMTYRALKAAARALKLKI
jgi:hypothetical protein